MGRQKIEYEKKLEIVRNYLSGKIGREESIRLANNSKSSFSLWVAQYKEGGATALLLQNMNNHYSPEVKLRAVLAYLSGEGSLETICIKYGLRSNRQLRDWIKVYNAHGDFNSVKQSGGGSYMKQGRDTTKEERLEIVKDCLASGKNYGEMALKYKVSYQQVRSWVLRFREKGEAGLEDRRGQRKKDQTPRTREEELEQKIAQLEHEKYLLEAENWLLKKVKELERGDVSHK